jgi:hypothetical protein
VSIRQSGLAAFAVLLSLVAALAPAGANPVTASCMALDLSAIQRTDATSVFAGMVTRTEAGHVWVQVEQWFLGKEPVESAEVIGGSQPNMITSADWLPSPGERYLVVAERAAPTGFVTRPCLQAPATVAILQVAGASFGVPREPPFATAAPSPSPQASGAAEASQPGLLAPLVLFLGAAVGAVLLTVLIRRRRASRISPSR